MTSRTMIEELRRLANRRSEMAKYYDAELKEKGLAQTVEWRTLLGDFLGATMDEVRSRVATEFARATLKLQSVDEAMFFRENVLRREARSEIGYAKQRDHSAHTVNNWLLGWLLYANSDSLREALHAAIESRMLTDFHPRRVFGDVWQYASVLHDVGYLFEGSIAGMSWDVHHDSARRGASVVNDFFGHRIWTLWGIHSLAQRDSLRERSGIGLPCLPESGSMAAIADGLRSLHGLAGLREETFKRWEGFHDKAATNINPSKTCLAKPDLLDGDAFDLWKAQYEFFGNRRMAMRVDVTRKAFDALVYEGLRGNRVRLIDHGVAGGLLLLQLLTVYFGIRFGLGDEPPDGWRDKAAWRKFRTDSIGETYDANFWWSGVLWGTHATALHNLQQMATSSDWPIDERLGPLALADDPLAYLGVLVDVLQEWDRYMVHREPHLAGTMPLQGIDVMVNARPKVQIDFGDKGRAARVRGTLDASLTGWQKIIRVKP